MSYPKLIDSSDFMTVQNSLWEIKVDHQTPTANWLERKITCDCPAFQKYFICKHSLGLAVNFLFWDRSFFSGTTIIFSGTTFIFSGTN